MVLDEKRRAAPAREPPDRKNFVRTYLVGVLIAAMWLIARSGIAPKKPRRQVLRGEQKTKMIRFSPQWLAAPTIAKPKFSERST
jgi:hypothetical protein